MWTRLGARGVTTMAWESFGEGWVTDAVKQLKIDPTVIRADYGELPDLSQVDWSTDVLFTWNGTTSGARVPNADWIPADREGLSFADATSGVFAYEMPWDKIDATAYTPQFNLSPYLPSLRELHDQRLAVNPEFIYVREQLALLEEQRQKESVSLNEKERRSEQDAFEARRLAIENTRRKAVGEEPLKDMAALRALDEQRSLDPENEMGDSDKPDPYLQETGAVLADLVRLLQNRQVANSEGAVLQE